MAFSALQRVLSRLRPAPIATAGALAIFLQQRASLIAQKCAIDYCRGKTGLASYALFTEKPFLDALDVCRWEAFAAVLGDLFILTEGHLRPHLAPGQPVRLHQALVAMHGSIFDGLPPPAHRPQGWQDALAAFKARFEGAVQGATPKALELADHSAKCLYDTLPIHSSYRELDEEVVYGAVRFRMIAVNQDLQRRLAPAPVLSQLLA